MTDPSPPPVAPTRTWRERNNPWLWLLMPLLALALAATGFRFARIYLPWTYSRPHIAQGSTMVFDQEWTVGGSERFHRTARIAVASVTPVEIEGGRRAVPGATLYRVELALSADRDVLMDGCDVMLLGPDGAIYGAGGGKQDVPGDHSRTFGLECVPADTPGPLIDPFTDQVTPAQTPRPNTWTVVTSVALPADVKPSKVRVQWLEPDYAVLDVPS